MPSLDVGYSPPPFFSLPPRPFPTEESVNDEDIYKSLPDLIEYVDHFQQKFLHPLWILTMHVKIVL